MTDTPDDTIAPVESAPVDTSPAAPVVAPSPSDVDKLRAEVAKLTEQLRSQLGGPSAPSEIILPDITHDESVTVGDILVIAGSGRAAIVTQVANGNVSALAFHNHFQHFEGNVVVTDSATADKAATANPAGTYASRKA